CRRGPPTRRSGAWGSVRAGGREVRSGRDAAARVHSDRDLLTARSVLEVELAVDDVDLHVIAGVELTVQDALGELVLDLALHGATQRTGAERRIEADVDQLVLRGIRPLDRHVPVEQAVAQLVGEQADDL